ncbi:MAG: aldehyde dehydrogenase family protein [Planctomycetota bacterium]|nr:aldehyde dehydrogenase family protein [Planctomycetota bacterium]
MNEGPIETRFELEIRRLADLSMERRKEPLLSRLKPVKNLRAVLVKRAKEFVDAAREDLGKSPGEVLGGEILPLAEACRFLGRNARKVLASRRSSRSPLWLGDQQWVCRMPHGVVGIIGTWNYPFFLSGVQIIQALTAGNSVVWKPSEVAPQSGAILEKALREAGFGPDRLVVLPKAREYGAWLCDQAIDFLVFTGAEATGRSIATKLGQRLIPSVLELSGADPLVVLEDFHDLELARKAIWFGIRSFSGQTCVAPRRILIHRSLYEPLIAPLRERFSKALLAPLATPGQLASAKNLVQDAVRHGAHVSGGHFPDSGTDYVMQPALIESTRTDLQAFREPCFAPLAVAVAFDRVEEIPEILGKNRFSLGASVFASDVDDGIELGGVLNSGILTVNDLIAPVAHPGSPFGGHGASGWGVTQGEEGLLAMTRPMVLSIRKGHFRPHYDQAWSGNDHRHDLWALLRLGHDKNWLGRLNGLWTLLTRGKSPF